MNLTILAQQCVNIKAILALNQSIATSLRKKTDFKPVVILLKK